MKNRQLLLLSSSRLYGHEYLHHAKAYIEEFLSKNNVKKILFIPYASSYLNYDAYLKLVSKPLVEWGYEVEGIHQHENPIEAVNSAKAIFTGGGNTFVLLKTLYEKNLIDVIRKRILSGGAVYIGSSAGTNVATVSINTTNDMPVVYPPSFDALNLVPFNINPHYIEPETDSTHKGETRDERINNFHEFNKSPVLALREGTALLVDCEKMTLKGLFKAKLFRKGKEPEEFVPESDLSFLLNV